MTTAIKVNPKLVNPKGDLDYFGEETGTPEFYIVSDILYKHLGKENISVSWDYNDFTYKIKVEKDLCEVNFSGVSERTLKHYYSEISEEDGNTRVVETADGDDTYMTVKT